MTRMRPRFLDCTGMTLEEAESFGNELAKIQRDVMFWVGDLARYCESRWPDRHHQVWPEWVSPGLLARTAGVCRAYPSEDERQIEATYTQFMQNSNHPDRLDRLAAIVDQGMTSDESRKPGWLLAVDVNYWVLRFYHSGAEVEAAKEVAGWIRRTVNRMRDTLGLTDVLCCFDSPTNFRKDLTRDWEDKYKGHRHEKDPELVRQITLVRDMLTADGFACHSVDDMEADDVMASAASSFRGKVTLLSQDKDCRQLLSKDVNILRDVEWSEDPTSGEMIPDYKWVSSKSHTEEFGLPPGSFVDAQILMGDSVDNIKGAANIGPKGAVYLVSEFGSAQGAIEAARSRDERLLSMTRGKMMSRSLCDLEEHIDIVRQLVELRTDLPIPSQTRV